MSVAVAERKKYPIYILLDVSESMRRAAPGRPAPLTEFRQMIPDLMMALADSSALTGTAWIRVIAFGDRPVPLCPMTSLAEKVTVKSPPDSVETDYTAALRYLHEQVGPDLRRIEAHGVRRDYRTKVARPLVFFVTDGAPYAGRRYQSPAEWLPYRDRLVEPPVEARIAAIGLVGAHPPTLWAMATGQAGGKRNAFVADHDASGDGLARSVIDVIQRSITLSVRAGDMVIDTPRGMHRVDG
ncbi:VWA domain-containing protein [Micromonospora sp. NPDC047644]|uniref:vWA domain-containing protein n=1 Tax=Micromonospora sp. NPDC047644 TaxID=3157203 RepID=UPI0034572FD2